MNAPTITTPVATWLANGSGITYTMRKVAIGFNGTGMVNQFELKGNGRAYNNFYVDSLLTSWQVQTQQLLAGTATITGDLTTQKLFVASTVLFHSLSGSGDGLIAVDSSGTLKRYNMTGHATDYFRGDGTFGNLSIATGWQLVGGTLLSTVNDVAIPGTVSVGHSINIGSFRLKNSALFNEADSVITDRNIQIMTLADKIALEADTVTMREMVRIGSDTSKYAPPVTGKLALEVAGSAVVSGDFAVKGAVNSNAVNTTNVNSNNVVANKIESKELVSDSLRVQNKATLGLLHVRDSIKIGNSIWLGGVNQSSGNNNGIYSDNGSLALWASGGSNPYLQLSSWYDPVLVGPYFIDNAPLQRKLTISSLSCAGSGFATLGGIRIEDYDYSGLCFFGGALQQRSAWDMIAATPVTSAPRFDFNSVTTNKNVMSLLSDGNVGIGTTSPQYALDVCGTIRADEFRVNLSGCDFVFDDDYPLMPLKTRKPRVLRQKHLFHISSAATMQQGIGVGELSQGILQNLEEHERYLYNHDERIEKLETENTLLKEKNKKQNEINEMLMKEIDLLKKR